VSLWPSYHAIAPPTRHALLPAQARVALPLTHLQSTEHYTHSQRLSLMHCVFNNLPLTCLACLYRRCRRRRRRRQDHKGRRVREEVAGGLAARRPHHRHRARVQRRLLLGAWLKCFCPPAKNLPKAWFNIVPYREVGLVSAELLEKDLQRCALQQRVYSAEMVLKRRGPGT
jgi:hypothetical protein